MPPQQLVAGNRDLPAVNIFLASLLTGKNNHGAYSLNRCSLFWRHIQNLCARGQLSALALAIFVLNRDAKQLHQCLGVLHEHLRNLWVLLRELLDQRLDGRRVGRHLCPELLNLRVITQSVEVKLLLACWSTPKGGPSTGTGTTLLLLCQLRKSV